MFSENIGTVFSEQTQCFVGKLVQGFLNRLFSEKIGFIISGQAEPIGTVFYEQTDSVF